MVSLVPWRRFPCIATSEVTIKELHCGSVNQIIKHLAMSVFLWYDIQWSSADQLVDYQALPQSCEPAMYFSGNVMKAGLQPE